METQRVLLIVNRASGTGNDEQIAGRLRTTITESLSGNATVEMEMVSDHPAARSRASSFLSASTAPAAIIAGGGGGTLRAVIEGICDGSRAGNLPGAERVRVAPLRMGSGNVLAKQFGIPRNPETALNGIVQNLLTGRTAPCCVLRCELDTAGGTEIHHAATLGGFGQFGRVPGDLARWHGRLPAIHRLAARLLSVERLTDVEYLLALLIRSFWCILFPGSAETIEISAADRMESMRLLTGLAMNFPLKAIPVDPDVRVEEEAWSLHLIPLQKRFAPLQLCIQPGHLARNAVRIKMERATGVTLKLLSPRAVQFFLDEDPMVLSTWIKLQVAGTLAFVPGPDYIWPDF